MKLQDMIAENYKLIAWKIANVKNENRIVVFLRKGEKDFVSSAPCAYTPLEKAEFNIPTEIVSA